MSDFQHPLLVRDVSDSRHINAATPRALKFGVSYARQLTPSSSTIADTVMMFGGLIRYGQDNDSAGEDLRNESSDYSELDGVGNNSPRTVMLQLRGPDLSDSQFAGSGAVSALGDSYFTWQDTFGTATDNAAALLTQPTENGNQLDHDLWFMSDVVAERTTGDTSQVNRSSYQATKPATSESGNRLIIFTGTAICGVAADGDGERSLGVVRIRLNFPLSNTLHFIGSATVAALASVHGDDPEEALFAVDAAQTVVGPSDGGSIPDNGLPANDLYVILDAATLGADTNLNRLAYQANVLLNDVEPDLKSILVRPSGTGAAFAPEATIDNASKWDFQITLTGPSD